MSLVSWNQDLSVNIKSIDDQHRKLIDMLNDFYDNIANRPNKENISKLVAAMKAYTIEHFTKEEFLMKKHGYSAFEEHKKQHESFMTKVNEIEERYNSGKLVLSLEMTSFLFDWLKNHIQVTDKKYSEFLINKGVK